MGDALASVMLFWGVSVPSNANLDLCTSDVVTEEPKCDDERF